MKKKLFLVDFVDVLYWYASESLENIKKRFKEDLIEWVGKDQAEEDILDCKFEELNKEAASKYTFRSDCGCKYPMWEEFKKTKLEGLATPIACSEW